MTDLPARPPEAELLRRARNRLRLSIREAAARASRTMPPGSGGRDGISEGRLRQIEAGYQTVSKGIQVPTSASDETLAYLARFYEITPEELESEGHRPEAAQILRRINAAQARTSGPLRIVSSAGADTTDPAEQVLADLLDRFGDDVVVDALARQYHKKAEMRVAEILEWLNRERTRGNGTAGLAPP